MRHHIYIGPEGRLAPCMGFSDTEMGKTFPSVLEEHLGKLTGRKARAEHLPDPAIKAT